MCVQCFQGSQSLDLLKKKQTLVNQFILFFSLPHLGLQDRNKINDPSGLPWTLSLCPQECVDLLFFLKLSGELQYPSFIVLTVCFEGVYFLFDLNPRFLQLFYVSWHIRV